jgi:hypothetical protein
VVATARVPVGALYGVSRWSIAIVAVALVLLPIAAFSEMAAEPVWPPDRPAVADQLDPVHDRG